MRTYTVERARHGKLDPVIGRDAEIRRTLWIRGRRTKNNPVLVGLPGVPVDELLRTTNSAG